MCFRRFYIFLTCISVILFKPIFTNAETIMRRATVMEAESSLVFFQIVNDYRLNTGKSSEGIIFNETLSQIRTIESHINCAGVRINQNWVLTTAKCGRILRGYLLADQ